MIQRTLLFISLLIASAGLLAQNEPVQTQDSIDFSSLEVMDYDNVREYTIAEVTVSGIEYIQKEVLISLSGLKVGNKVKLPGDEITDLLKKFWSQGLFSDARITATQIRNDSVWIDIYLTEQSRMSRLQSSIGA